VLGLVLAANSPTFGVLLLAFLLMGIANGPILGVGQAFLIDGKLDESLRTMTRWTLMGALGDLCGPLLIGAAFAWGMGWRGLFWASALLWLVALVALAIQHLPETIVASHEVASHEGVPDKNKDAEGPVGWRAIFDTVRDDLLLALRTPRLLRWLLLVMMPSFLDEMFLGFAALLLQERMGMTPAAISVAIGVHVAGGLIGLVLLDRVGHRLPAAQALGWLALVVAGGLLLFVLATAAWLAVVALWIIGLGVSGWYPVAAAEAYRAFPGRSGIVRALYSLTTPLEVLAPLLIGLAAESWGIQAGVTLLLLAPLAVLILRPRATQSALES
jgi:MFS family permease